jgi:hypothetical protein
MGRCLRHHPVKVTVFISSSSDFFDLDIIACSDVHWSAHLLVGLSGSLRPRGL